MLFYLKYYWLVTMSLALSALLAQWLDYCIGIKSSKLWNIPAYLHLLTYPAFIVIAHFKL